MRNCSISFVYLFTNYHNHSLHSQTAAASMISVDLGLLEFSHHKLPPSHPECCSGTGSSSPHYCHHDAIITWHDMDEGQDVEASTVVKQKE